MKKYKYIFHIFKFIIAFLLVKILYRSLYKKKIWLIGEKNTEARDNAYHLFKYIRENHPELNAYYVITKNSIDLHKIEKYGNIVYCSTIKHYIYFLTAKNNINAQQPNSNSAFSLWGVLSRIFPFLLNKNQYFIYLKHGIEKDYKNPNFHYKKTGISIVSCATERERNYIMQEFGYPDKNALLLGFCRFDKLHNIDRLKKNQIIIMPTFRRWLVASDRTKEATTYEKEQFKKSNFYKFYIELMKNKHLENLLEKLDYKLVFYPHYSIQSYINLFKEEVQNNRILIADRLEYDVQELLISSKVMITDFSSVFFDFAYMNKPEIFFQFDEDEYRKNHYKKGYFNYENDGFGPVVKSTKLLLEELEKVMLNGAKMENKYLKRTNEFFTVRDTNNCRRTFEAIKNLS